MPALPPRPIAAAVAIALTACAGCGEPDPVERAGTTLRLTLSEYRIAPQAVRVTAGRMQLVVHNDGTMVHRLKLRTADRSRTLAATPPLRPGETARLAVRLPPGRYVTTCSLDRHDTLGEHGTLEVR